MPLQRYRPLKPPCRICGQGFEIVGSTGDPPLTECPTCGQLVIPAGPQAVSSPQLTRPVGPAEARTAGFKVFRKTSDGSLERL
ncbi:MAG: zinc ribbon domain-containing protein [Opitutaceae bacterium]